MPLRSIANLLLKVSLSLLLGWVLYRQIAEHPLPKGDGFGWSQALLHRTGWYLLPCIVLVPLNLWLEVRKWQLLQRPMCVMGWRTAVRGVLVGITLGILTPNRVGEYGGRAMLARHGGEGAALVSTALGGMAQWLAILGCGIPGLLMYSLEQGYLPSELTMLVTSLGVLAFGLMCWIYFNLGTIFLLLQKLDVSWKPVRQVLVWLRSLVPLLQDRQHRWSALLLAFLRYGIYTSQYVLLLAFFDIRPGWWTAWCGVSSIFLIQSGMPLPPVMGLLARGELAILFWQPLGAAPVAVLSATFLLFVLNLGIPALVGWWWMTRLDIWSKVIGWWRKGPNGTEGRTES